MKHPRLAEPGTLLVGLPLALVAALTCMQVFCLLGVIPNTSLFGATAALGVGRLLNYRFRHSSRQNLVQTMVSGAGFTAANVGLLVAALVFVLGFPQLVMPMLLGSVIGVLVDIYLGYRLFGRELFPPQGAWPQGYATAALLRAQDETGARVWRLVSGALVGSTGGMLGLPTLAVGMGFLGDGRAMLVLGLGMLAGGILPWSAPYPSRELVAAALMVGAGLVQLGQTVRLVFKGRQARRDFDTFLENGQNGLLVEGNMPVRPWSEWWWLLKFYIPFGIGSLFLAAAGGFFSSLEAGTLALFLLYTPMSALVSTLCTGWSAMVGGWLTVFGITLIFFAGGIWLGLPPVALALLTGYTLSTGPLLADMGNDLKAGWILRGFGQDPAYERSGEYQQLLAKWVGALAGMAMVCLFLELYLGRGLVPPVVLAWREVFGLATTGGVGWEFFLLALCGAGLQFLSPARRSLGIALAVGLIVANPLFGLGLVGAVICRQFLGDEVMELRDLGLILGDGFTRFLLLLLT